MSFATGNGGIFDQVNRFYTNGNNVLVEQTPNEGNDNDPHTHIMSEIDPKQTTENMDNVNFNSFFNDISKYTSPGTSMQNVNHIDLLNNVFSGGNNEHPVMSVVEGKDPHDHQHPLTNDNDLNMYLDSFESSHSSHQAHNIDFKGQQSFLPFDENVSGNKAPTQRPGRKLSQDVTKYSPGISPTVEAAQPPQYTPYLQARNSRYSSNSIHNGKKVVKYSPNMKPIGSDKRNSYKVILPSNSMSSTPQSSTFDKKHSNGNTFSYQDQINSDTPTDSRSFSMNENLIHKTTSNSSAYAEEKKVLRATQSPVIKPMKKRSSNANLNVNKDFNLDSSNQHLSPEMGALKKTVSRTMYSQVLEENTQSSPTIPHIPNSAVETKKRSGSGHRTVKKKEVHKEAEKHRRERLNIALEDLNDIIPPEMKENDRFPSKASTVEHAAEYIRFLINELNKRDIPIEFTVPEETYNPKERKGSI